MTLLSFPFLKSASPHHSVPVLPAAPPLPPFPSMALITGILSPITRGLFSAAGFLYAHFYVLPAISPTRFFSPSSSLIPPSPFPFSSHFFMPGLPGSSPPSFPSVSISESSFYRLRKRFTLDSKELIRILKSFSDNLDLLEFLRSSTPFILHSALELFFRSAGYSFLQPCVNLRPRINLRSIPPGFYQIP